MVSSFTRIPTDLLSITRREIRGACSRQSKGGQSSTSHLRLGALPVGHEGRKRRIRTIGSTVRDYAQKGGMSSFGPALFYGVIETV